MIRGQEIFTKVLSGQSITLTADMGLTSISIVLISGAGAFRGSLNVSDNVTTYVSEAVDLILNQAVVIASDSGLPLNGLTIDATGGVVHVLGRQ